MNYNLLGKLVENSKLNKLQIAKATGISRTTLDNAIAGADIKISTLESLARVLSVNPSVFFEDTARINNIASGNNSVATVDNSTNKVSNSEERMKYLEKLLEEKERTINILMGKK